MRTTVQPNFPTASGATQHLIQCNCCGADARVLDATDLPPTWAACVVDTLIFHCCPDCCVPRTALHLRLSETLHGRHY